jgi:hypothetical protein
MCRSARKRSALAEARTIADAAKRRQIYFELQQIIHDECPTIFPAFASWVDAARKDVKGFVPNPNFMLSDSPRCRARLAGPIVSGAVVVEPVVSSGRTEDCASVPGEQVDGRPITHIPAWENLFQVQH